LNAIEPSSLLFKFKRVSMKKIIASL